MDILINLTDKEGIPHKHKNYEIIIFTKGTGTFVSDNKETEVFPGKFIIVPPNTFHKCIFDTELERIYISGKFDQIFNFTTPVIIADSNENEGLTLAKILYSNRYSNTEYVKAVANALTHFLLKSYKADNEINVIINDIIEKMTNEFYDSGFNVGELLKSSGYAQDYIRARFKAVTGKTPVGFLTQIRIDHARYLIDIYKSSLTLAEISEKCGYTDYIYFSRKFKQLTGICPIKYAEM